MRTGWKMILGCSKDFSRPPILGRSSLLLCRRFLLSACRPAAGSSLIIF